MHTRAGTDVSEEIRCPSCSRLLVLRSGARITPHFAHRPRQACRRRPGPAPGRLRLEQLTLFDVEPLTPPQPVPVFYFRPRPVPGEAPAPASPGRRAARRRRKAWLPRLIRWLRARSGSV